MLTLLRRPTKSDKKFGRADCVKCKREGLLRPAVHIWGCRPNLYPLCVEHHNEYVDAIIDRLQQRYPWDEE